MWNLVSRMSSCTTDIDWKKRKIEKRKRKADIVAFDIVRTLEAAKSFKTIITIAWHFEIIVLSEREVYHEICHGAISKIVKFRIDCP
jgi:predicted ATPase